MYENCSVRHGVKCPSHNLLLGANLIKEKSHMPSNFVQIGLYTSELLALRIFPMFSHISHSMQWKKYKIKTKDEYKEIFQEMIQHPMPFKK